VLDLAFANQVSHGASNVLDRDVRVDAMLIEEIDPLRPKPLQRRLGHLADVRWTAIEAGLLSVLELEAELGRDHHPIANRLERFADQRLIHERPVRFGRVEERDASVDGRADEADRIISSRSRAVSEAQAHAPEAQSRYFQSACSQQSRLHSALLRHSFSIAVGSDARRMTEAICDTGVPRRRCHIIVSDSS
jgi:hypothetical protein